MWCLFKHCLKVLDMTLSGSSCGAVMVSFSVGAAAIRFMFSDLSFVVGLLLGCEEYL
jgi:hypothetical protein